MANRLSNYLSSDVTQFNFSFCSKFQLNFVMTFVRVIQLNFVQLDFLDTHTHTHTNAWHICVMDALRVYFGFWGICLQLALKPDKRLRERDCNQGEQDLRESFRFELRLKVSYMYVLELSYPCSLQIEVLYSKDKWLKFKQIEDILTEHQVIMQQLIPLLSWVSYSVWGTSAQNCIYPFCRRGYKETEK